jgi:O-antigen ligase
MVDYLIPTVYLTDILIILLLVFKPIKKIFKPGLIFLACLLPAVIFSSSFVPAACKWLKLLEMVLLFSWVRQYRPEIKKFLTLAIIFQSLLAIAQWFHQGSIFGYWFLGEQPFNASTPGIDKIVWFDGSLKIPPLGTFPHPNVLAGFLAVTLPLIFPRWTFFLGLIPLFLTFSLSAWLAFLLIGLPLCLKLNLRKLMIYYGCLLIILSLFGHRFSYLAPESSFSRRSQLTQMSLKMFRDHPLAGVGLNNFTVTMDQYGYIPATTRFLQPVHNLYLLILCETGLLGAFGFLYLIFKGRPYRISLLVLLFLGLFDHYFFTLQQGLLLLVFTLFL